MIRPGLSGVFYFVLSAVAFASPTHNPWPGGTAVIGIGAADTKSAPVVIFGGKRVLVLTLTTRGPRSSESRSISRPVWQKQQFD